MKAKHTRYAVQGVGVRPTLRNPQQLANVGSFPVKVRTNTDRANRPVFLARINPHGLLCLLQIVRGGGSVYRGAGFLFQRRELLKGCCLHGFRFRVVENHIFFWQLSTPTRDKWCPLSPSLGDTF